MTDTPELKPPQMEFLSMGHVERAGVPKTSKSYCRILFDGQRIKYVCIDPGVYDQSVMDSPFLLLEHLPLHPSPASWNSARIKKSPNGEIIAIFKHKDLPEVTTIWHQNLVDTLSLNDIRKRNNQVSEVAYGSGTAVSKIARFHWEIGYLERETHIYSLIDGHGIGPRFLGHVTDGMQGRVIGLLIEKLEGRHAGIGDIVACQEVLKKLHSLGMTHGDVNRYNFLVTATGARLIDFEDTKPGANAEEMEKELNSLEEQLVEETGRGRALYS